jgi:hypothetical protein
VNTAKRYFTKLGKEILTGQNRDFVLVNVHRHLDQIWLMRIGKMIVE